MYAIRSYYGFSEADLELLFEALTNMFDHDHSAARGEMACRGLYVFRHDSKLGCAPAHTLLERVKVQPLQQPARGFEDFQVTVMEEDLPAGVSLV